MASPGSLASNPPPRWGAPGDDLVGDPSGRRQARDPGSGPRSLGPSEIPTVSIASHSTSPSPTPTFHRRPRLRAVPDAVAHRHASDAGPRPPARGAPRPGADPVGRPRRLRQPRPRGIHPGVRAGGARRRGGDPHLLERAPRHRLALAGSRAATTRPPATRWPASWAHARTTSSSSPAARPTRSTCSPARCPATPRWSCSPPSTTRRCCPGVAATPCACPSPAAPATPRCCSRAR